jgi:outer membrane receptor for ferrienterochelin and colicins
MRFLFAFGFILSGPFLMAQQIIGTIQSHNNPVPFAHVIIENTNTGATSDNSGFFSIKHETTATSVTLIISVLGYEKLKKNVSFSGQKSIDLGIIELKEDVLGLEEVVISASLEESYVRDSPVKTTVISSKMIQKFVPAQNLIETLGLINGVEEVIACGVCYTNSISINGLQGPYTALLIDGSPIYGNLAAVYGLNGIPTGIVERVEVIRGPNSTLYGSEAMAGVINIITKKPANEPLLSTEIKAGSLGTSNANLAMSNSIKKWSSFTGINIATAHGFIDKNNDGFADRPDFERISLFSKWNLSRDKNREFSIAARYYQEDRRSGVAQFLTDHRQLRGNDSIYGEAIVTNRAELFGSYDFKSLENFRLDYSLSYHSHSSYYGDVLYKAKQQTAFTNFTWRKSLKRHFVLAGAALRQQFYSDNTPATANGSIPENQFIPGIFLQNEWRATRKLTVLLGNRLDYYSEHGIIWSPRLSAKIELSDWTSIRFNSGTGFRTVNLFTEDHAFVSGQRQVEIAEKLRPEQSYNATLGINHLYKIMEQTGTIEADVFYNHFTNKIIPDYSESGKIIYRNSRGYAQSFGAGINVNHQFSFPLNVRAGFNAQQVSRTEILEDNMPQKQNIEFAPRWTSLLLVAYTHRPSKLELSYTLRATGPMQLPEVYDNDEFGEPLFFPRPTVSKPFVLHNIQVTRKFNKINLEVFGGVQNLFNYRQPESPLVGYNDPNSAPGFGENFDTVYTYAPMLGREIFVGLRWNSKK